MELLGLGFLLGLLGSGFGYVVEHVITERAHHALLRRALVAEIRENMRRLGGGDQAWAVPAVPLIRTAWDQARGLSLSTAAFDAIAAGFQAGTHAHELATLVIAVAGRPMGLIDSLRLPAIQRKNLKMAQNQSWAARLSFEKALTALGEDADLTPRPSSETSNWPRA